VNATNERRFEIARLFSPAAPVAKQQLFAGRQSQMDLLLQTVAQAGQHAVIYGERGVGKTSLAATMADLLQGTDIAARTNCDGTDTFGTIWRKVLEEVRLVQEVSGAGFAAEAWEIVSTAADALPADENVSPNDVRRVLQRLGQVKHVVIFIDEFDRLTDEASRGHFADTIKTLSDQLIDATLVLVGVADNVDQLIAEHRSVERAVVQIPMPRMSAAELGEIVDRVGSVEMTIESDARGRITRLSQGLPHYTHLLAQAAALSAVDRGSTEITLQDVNSATQVAIANAQESIISAYHRATMSTRETLYPQVVLACALTQGDDLGYFASGDVREPLTAIMKRPYDIPAFSQHLNELSDPKGGRGPVLQKIGSTRKFRFRFINPLLQPYVIMKGIAEGTLGSELLERFTGQ
jgi:Cdc6-like AAA superfamily ATPase